MVAPLTPTSKQYTLFRMEYLAYWDTWYKRAYVKFLRSGTNQKPPFTIDTALYCDVILSLSTFAGDGVDVQVEMPNVSAGASNKAYAKFVGALGDSSSFGATLTTELRSTWNTVSGGITNALLAANAVRRGQLGQAAKILRFYPPTETIMRSKRRRKLKNGRFAKKLVKTVFWKMPDGKRIAKSAGNNWLWYSYGVKPLVQDIYNGMDVLTRPLPSTKVEGSGSSSEDTGVGGDFYQTRKVCKSSVRCSAYVRVNNPNLWLANKLGLINPVQFFLEGVKLSFVVDWFSNLTQVVNQMTDFAGLEITRPLKTSKHVGDLLQLHPDYKIRLDSRRIIVRRELTLPVPKLVFAYERFQWQRGLNAISLLLGVLKNTRK